MLGVATALAGEQAAQTLHDHAKAAEARASIRMEIARNLGRMNARQALESCIGKRLDEVDGLITASAAGALPPEALWIGSPPNLSMFDSTYKAAMQSGTVSLFDYSEQRSYANLYSAFEIYWQSTMTELRSWGDLRTLERHPSASATLDWQLRSAMQQARIARAGIGSMRYYALHDAAAIGVAPGHQELFKNPSVCLPLHTPREEALKGLAATARNVPVP